MSVVAQPWTELMRAAHALQAHVVRLEKPAGRIARLQRPVRHGKRQRNNRQRISP